MYLLEFFASSEALYGLSRTEGTSKVDVVNCEDGWGGRKRGAKGSGTRIQAEWGEGRALRHTLHFEGKVARNDEWAGAAGDLALGGKSMANPGSQNSTKRVESERKIERGSEGIGCP